MGVPAAGSAKENPALQLQEVQAAACAEWRVGEKLPPSLCEVWMLVYVMDGVIEETTDGRPTLVRAGRVLIHQPEETWSMRAAGEVPPEVLRMAFRASGTAMDLFRDRLIRVNQAEKNVLRLLADAVRDTWQRPEQPGMEPTLRPDPPFGAPRLTQLYLEQFLWLTARRLRRGGRKPAPRTVAEQNQRAIVDAARLYFSEHIEEEPDLAEICKVLGCGRVALQQAFRVRTGLSPRGYYSCLKAERAGSLLAQGYTPGEVTRMLGYSSTSYFSQRFRALTGRTPTEYRQDPQPLHLCNK